ncbi:MAG: nitroreductase family protein, partial [bacterium]
DGELAELMNIVRGRRSVRRYDGARVSKETLKRVARVVDHAPGFGGRRCWKFFVAGDERLVRGLISACGTGLRSSINPWLRAPGIPAFVVACARPGLSGRSRDRHFYVSDTSVAMEFLVLSAWENGLGTCWIGAFEEEPVKRALGHDGGFRVVAVSPLGYPMRRTPKALDLAGQYDRYAVERMHKRRLPQREILSRNVYGRRFELPCAPGGAPGAVEGGAGSAAGRGETLLSLVKGVRFAKAFSGRAVEDWKIGAMVEAARLAPSASNAQPWRFILVDDDRTKERLESAAWDDDGLPVPFASAPVVIAAVATEESLIRMRGEQQPYYLIDVPIALSHVMLAASSLGVALNLSFVFSEKKVKEILRIPARCRVVALVAAGYPTARKGGDAFPLQYFSASAPGKSTFTVV